MLQKNILLFFMMIPAFLVAQDSVNKCEIVFTKVRQLPSLIISEEAFQDTLTKELKRLMPQLNNRQIIYKFIVTKEHTIEDLSIEFSSVTAEKKLRELIFKLQNLWEPAKQNGYDVCAYVRVQLVFENKSVKVSILQ